MASQPTPTAPSGGADSTTPPTTVEAPRPDPLGFMTQLSPNVYIYRPSPPSSSSAPASSSPTASAPKLILICSWMGARPLHIAKYLTAYRALYPTTPLLLVRFELRHMLWPSAAEWRTEIATVAAPALLSLLPSSSSEPAPNPEAAAKRDPEMLVHVFSNGGSFSFAELRTVLTTTTTTTTASPTPSRFPTHTTVFDSTPGLIDYRGSYTAMTTGWPTWTLWVGAPLIHLLVAWFCLVDPLTPVARLHNERSGRASNEVRRTYIYSDADALVDARHVELHAHDARAAGFLVRTAKFVGTPHVAHVRADEQRYWRLVRETWEGWGKDNGNDDNNA